MTTLPQFARARRLNGNNVFDTNPPDYRVFSPGGIQGFTNGGTLGRLFQLSVSKKF